MDHIFRIYDKDRNGGIDFNLSCNYSMPYSLNCAILQEFMIATDMTSSGSIEEKLRWAFKMFDKDESGYD